MTNGNDLTRVDHWNDTWAGDIRLRLPSPLIVATRDLQRLLKAHVREGNKVLEIGCAPGKLLAWIAAVLRASVAGIDYSPRGLAQTHRLFSALNLTADLRCEDFRGTTFPANNFDVVFSVGVIEHFDDPRDIVRKHLSLVRPGGTALMTVPNYSGIYGRLQRYFDAESLLFHNTKIMSCEALAALVPSDEPFRVKAYPFGRISPWLLSTTKRWPRPVALGISHAVNLAAVLQPVDIRPLCPMLVLEVVRPLSS
jgi:2-polyprenyl-3-methyl-5-hydroxy-6-metoxy-1,4-benzoquinol methylase